MWLKRRKQIKYIIIKIVYFKRIVEWNDYIIIRPQQRNVKKFFGFISFGWIVCVVLCYGASSVCNNIKVSVYGQWFLIICNFVYTFPVMSLFEKSPVKNYECKMTEEFWNWTKKNVFRNNNLNFSIAVWSGKVLINCNLWLGKNSSTQFFDNQEFKENSPPLNKNKKPWVLQNHNLLIKIQFHLYIFCFICFLFIFFWYSCVMLAVVGCW